MIVSRVSPMTGKVNKMDLDINELQMAELQQPSRRLIQDILPNLSNEEREFVKTGYTPEDWQKMFPPEEE